MEWERVGCRVRKGAELRRKGRYRMERKGKEWRGKRRDGRQGERIERERGDGRQGERIEREREGWKGRGPH